MKPKATHIFLKEPELTARLRSESERQHRSIRAVVTIALQRYFAALDRGADA